jgi:glyoxylase-like metal-dependent hydrolase (beta-lactamase superfamily II)
MLGVRSTSISRTDAATIALRKNRADAATALKKQDGKMVNYEIYSILFGRNETRTSKENFLGGDLHDKPMPMNFYVWAIIGGGRAFVVDTGFDAKAAAARSRSVNRPVDAGLKAIGVDTGTVKDVVITHMHWDHAGNHEMFPNATYHIQDAEMAYCTGRCMCHSVLRMPFEAADVQAMVGRVFAGRAHFHAGVSELAPGLSLHLIGGHSKGLQCLRVHTRRGWVVLASDVAHYYAHLTERRVFPVTYNVGETLEGYRIVHELADSPAHIVPGHDPLVHDRYPAADPKIEGIVRLDADPN